MAAGHRRAFIQSQKMAFKGFRSEDEAEAKGKGKELRRDSAALRCSKEYGQAVCLLTDSKALHASISPRNRGAQITSTFVLWRCHQGAYIHTMHLMLFCSVLNRL